MTPASFPPLARIPNRPDPQQIAEPEPPASNGAVQNFRPTPALAAELVAAYGTPLYGYSGDRLRDTLRQITASVPYPHTRFQFASVTNGNVNLLRIFREAGWGLHANTPGDIYLARHASFDPADIVYSGSNLNREEIAQVLRWGVRTLNLDSLDQLRLLGEVYGEIQPGFVPIVGLRLNLPEVTGDSRIGVNPADFAAAVAIAQQAGLTIAGLHFYRGTGTNATAAFTQSIDPVIAAAQQLPDWRYLDFGGGFGYPYYHRSAAFNWAEFGQALSDRLSQVSTPSGSAIDLIIEPGRAAIAGCAALITQVVSTKWQGEKQIVGVDTTVANLSVPAVHGGYREIVALSPALLASDRPHYLTDVCGNTTYSRDYLGRGCHLPALSEGDLLAILDVGAYGYAMSSHFLHRPRPPEVLVETQAGRLTHRLIRQREDYSILLSHQILPPT
ncbi:diaminopimelate decarboxylase family protein [Thermoleptolyngbya sp.]